MRVRLIRRAKAGRRGSGPKNDALRPLSEEGRAQARGLMEQLDGQRIDRILSSPYQRCLETVEPLAKRRGLEIEVDERLVEGASSSKAVAVLRSLGESEAAICTHSDVIGKLLGDLAPRVKARDKRLRRRKASMWLLEGDLDGRLKGQYEPPSPRRDEEPRRVAVLDLGSTSFHLLVGDVGPDGSIERVVRERDMLRLGALISEHAHIPLADCDRAIESVLRLREVAESVEAEQLIAIATSAFREARNGNLLARVLGRVIGTPVKILSGNEEARTIFSAYRRRMDLGPKRELGLDLGGGSLELAVGDASGVEWETQERYTLGEYSWELPMGGAPLDENPLTAARRELKEETGLSAVQWSELMRVHTSNSITDEVGHVFVATELTEGETDFEETEDLAIRKLTLQEAVQMVIDGAITDAISAAALLRLHATRTSSSL